jgi:hypothetical protein
MSKKKLLDFSRVGKSMNNSNFKTVGKVVGGGLIGEILPSVFQRVTGIQSSGVIGNAASGAIATVMLLAMNQPAMAAGVVATKSIKAIITYGNPVAVKLTSVPIALPSTRDGFTVTVDPNNAQMISPNAGTNDFMGDDMPIGGVQRLTLPNGRVIEAVNRDENPTVNYDTGGRSDALSEFISEASLNESLSDRYADPLAMLGDPMFDETMGI